MIHSRYFIPCGLIIILACSSIAHITTDTNPGIFDKQLNELQRNVTEERSLSDNALEECTSVIVTGNAAKNGRAILMKNRDSIPGNNRPVYHPSTSDTFAFVAVNSMWMGINEHGLAMMNTAMMDLAENPGSGYDNGILNRRILEICENVSDVVNKLSDESGSIGSEIRGDAFFVATCIGVVDQFGKGAFIEVSDSQISVEYVINGYQSRANHPRTYPGLASGPSGRDQYALDALDAIYSENGVITWEDIAQRVSRCVRESEQGSSAFSIAGEICNDNTVSAMVAVSGDSRYDGKLNAMWCEYGQVPLVGVFLPSMVLCGTPPPILNEFDNYTEIKQDYAEGTSENIYNPIRVREIQDYAFAAERFTFDQYDILVKDIPENLSDAELADILDVVIDHSVRVAADMYVNETAEIPDYGAFITFSDDLTETVPTTNALPDTTQSTTNIDGENNLLIPLVVLTSSVAVIVLSLLIRFKRK
ncbi:MAG: carcinine hydrolase/isopenicillin-N N-acyltransferase family protein [Candidatus Thorarchaeota archaeon]